MCSVVVNYTVIVNTGINFGAGTDANVSMTIYGSLGNTNATQLAKSYPADPFENSNSDQFIIKAFDLGESNTTPQ